MSPKLQVAGTLVEGAVQASRRATEHLLGTQAEQGYWWAELTADTTLESDYILLQLWLHPPVNGVWAPPTRSLIEKAAHCLENLCALDEDFADLGVHVHVDVAAAVAQLDVGEAVPLLGQGQQILGEESQLFDVDAELSGAGAEEVALGADEVAEVEQLVESETFFADVVEAHVELEALAVLLDMGEAGLALAADRHQAAGNAHVDVVRLEFLGSLRRVVVENLGNRVGGLVLVGVDLLAKSFNLFELVDPLLVDVVF